VKFKSWRYLQKKSAEGRGFTLASALFQVVRENKTLLLLFQKFLSFNAF
jgi:hypothetical protein